MIQSGVTGQGDEARAQDHRSLPLALADEFGVDPLRYHLLREVPLGGDGDFSYEGIVGRYNADLANNLGNLWSRVATVVIPSAAGSGPLPTRTAPWRRAPPRCCAPPPTRGPAGPPRGPGGHLAADRGDECRVGGHRALEDGAGTRGRRRAGQRPRGAADRGRPDFPPCRPPPRRSGAGSAWRATRPPSGCPRPPGGGPIPAVWPS